MKKELISKLHGEFEKCAQCREGVEFWLARDLQRLLGYEKWDNFLKVIEKAKMACFNSKHAITDHFADVGKMVTMVLDVSEAKDFANEVTNVQVVQQNSSK